jgi:hypothetical protein
MPRDRIQEAIEPGQNNLRTLELVRNWCAHAKMVKAGGTGIVEMQTGLPIGHHHLECPHAPAGGMATFHLADAALDFYDRNCVDCKFRQPVGLPNLLKLVAERDAQKNRREEERARIQKTAANRLAVREKARQRIRTQLDALSAATLDQISELDQTRSDKAALKLVELAGLAPETFVSNIVEHLFALLEANEYWLIEPCLKALFALKSDPARLCEGALRALHSYSGRETAAAIVKAQAVLAKPELIAGALHSLISLANPAPSRFGSLGRRQISDDEPLKALFAAHPAAVKAGIKSLLEQTDAYEVQYAARGIDVLSENDAKIREDLMPQMVSKLVRSQHLVKGQDDEVDAALGDLRDVVTQGFLAQPDETDALFDEYLEGATKENAKQLYKVYDTVLHGLRFRRHDQEVKLTDAHRLAFRRLVVAATKHVDDDSTDPITSLFSGDPYDLTPLAQDEIGLLLGSAAILDTKLSELEDQKSDRADQLYWLQLMGRRSSLNNLLNCFIRWSCVAAGKSGSRAIDEVLHFLHALPESSVNLRATFIGNFDCLMADTDALSQCLPDFYSALVGSEQLIRSTAATALGEMRSRVRDNLPSLVFEAFAALLTDPYKIVHKAAVRALDRFRLPESQNGLAIRALGNLIAVYARDEGEHDFLMSAIVLYGSRYVKEERLSGNIGDTLVDIAMTLEPWIVAKEMRFWGRLFRNNTKFPTLLLRLMADGQAMSLYHGELLTLLQQLPRPSIYMHREAILSLGRTLPARPNLPQIGVLIEVLSAAGAWKELDELSQSVFRGIEDTMRDKQVRLYAKLYMLACSLERSLSEGLLDTIVERRKDWNSTLDEIAQDHAINKQRRDPLRGLLDSH